MKTKFDNFKVNEGKYLIKYGLGGGFGGAINDEIEEFSTQEEAENYAWQKACEYYEQYEGLHGLRTTDEIMEEDEVDEEEAQRIYEEERESWLDYESEPYLGESTT